MPSISPVHSVLVEGSEARFDEEPTVVNYTPLSRRTRSDSSSSSESSPTSFGERLKAARKLLPSHPGRARLERSPRELEQSAKSTSKLPSRDFCAILREHAILMEYKALSQYPQSGVYVIPSLKSLQVWHGIIFPRAGPYRDGIFRFVVILQDDFPNSRPLLKFTQAVFHPQIHASGILNLDVAFPKWQRNVNGVWQILKFMKNCFYNVDTWKATNQEAANVVNHSLEEFKEKAQGSALESLRIFDEESGQGLSDDDGNVLKMKHLNEWAFREGKRMMLNGEIASFDKMMLSGKSGKMLEIV